MAISLCPVRYNGSKLQVASGLVRSWLMEVDLAVGLLGHLTNGDRRLLPLDRLDYVRLSTLDDDA